MGEKERVSILEDEKIDKNIYFYLESLFKQLNIEICGRCAGNLFDLMMNGKLEGWCWQTTESAALFMPNDSIVYRGNLYFNDHKPYYHSFIQFDYEGKKYVFDPCLCMINTSDLYFEILKVDVKGQVTAKKIKDFFINYINNSPKKKSFLSSCKVSSIERFMKKFFGDDYSLKNANEVVIHDNEDPSAPMYRNGSGYRCVDIDKDKIKSLTVHYYMCG